MRITRRTFLAGTATAGAALWAGGAEALRAAAGRPDLVFAIVSDTHLGRPGPEDPVQGLKDAVAEINASPAAFTLFLGDLVDKGKDHEPLYPEWAKLAKGLARPWHAVPGNHDPEPFFRRYVQPQTETALEAGGVRFVLFQSTDTESHDGSVTPERMKWIAEQVAEAAARRQPVILGTHIPRHPNAKPDSGWYIRTPQKEFEDLLRARAGTVAALFAGHLHYGLRGWDDVAGVQEVAVPSLCWNKARDLSQAPGYAMKEAPRGYVLASLSAGRMTLRYKALGAEGGQTRALDLPAARAAAPAARP